MIETTKLPNTTTTTTMTLLFLFLFVILYFPHNTLSLGVPGVGFSLSGTFKNQHLGRSSSVPGDFDNDGYPDILSLSPYTDSAGLTGNGAFYILFGGPGHFPASFNLSYLNSSNSLLFYGNSSGANCAGFSFLGDINGDQYDDIGISCQKVHSGGQFESGELYIIYGGPRSSFIFNSSIAFINGTNGIVLQGFGENSQFNTLSPAGDFNGDGYPDVIFYSYYFSSPGYNYNGIAYLMYGGPNLTSLNISAIDSNSSLGFRVEYPLNYFYLRTYTSPIGDVNNDGFADIAIRNYQFENGNNRGSVMILYGTNASISSPFDLKTINGTNGIYIHGANEGDGFGGDIAGLFDFNGDGYDDFVISANSFRNNGIIGSGRVYLFYGGPWIANSHEFNVSDFNSTHGVIFLSTKIFARLGQQVQSIGDINKDGYDDIIIGAPRYDTEFGSRSGICVLVYGHPQYPYNPMIIEDPVDPTNALLLSAISSREIFSRWIIPLGDFNNDTFPDFALASPSYSDPNGEINIGKLSIFSGTDLVGYSRNLTTNSFTKCSPGTYYPFAAITEEPCYQCEPGTFVDTLGSTECIPCPIATYQDQYGQSECVLCGPGTIGSIPKSSSIDFCEECPPSSYSSGFGSLKCIRCPFGSECKDSGMEYPRVAPGYQYIKGDYFPCYPSDACPGGKDIHSVSCGSGYTQPTSLCTQCDTGFHHLNGQCVSCSGVLSGFVVLYFILFFASLIIIASNLKIINKFLLLVSPLQALSLLAFIHVIGSSPTWKFTFDLLSTLFLFNFEAISCQTSFLSQSLLQLIAPIISILYLAFLHLVLYFFSIKRPNSWIVQHTLLSTRDDDDDDVGNRKFDPEPAGNLENKTDVNLVNLAKAAPTQEQENETVQDDQTEKPITHTSVPFGPPKLWFLFRTTSLISLYLLYPITTFNAMSYFSFKIINGNYVLAADSSVIIFSPEWWSLSWLAAIVIIVYTAGFPLYIFTTSSSSPIFTCYKPDYTYWESVLLVRNALMITIIIGFPEHPFIVSTLIVALTIVMILLYQRFQPHSSTLLFISDLFFCLLSVIIVLLPMAFTSSSGHDTGDYGILASILIIFFVIIRVIILVLHRAKFSSQ